MQDDIEMWFTYHAPNDEQQRAFNQIRNNAKTLALIIDEAVPDCPDKVASIRKLRECVMTANAAIACKK